MPCWGCQHSRVIDIPQHPLFVLYESLLYKWVLDYESQLELGIPNPKCDLDELGKALHDYWKELFPNENPTDWPPGMILLHIRHHTHIINFSGKYQARQCVRYFVGGTLPSRSETRPTPGTLSLVQENADQLPVEDTH